MKSREFTFVKKTLSTSEDGLGCRVCKVIFEDSYGNVLIKNMDYEDWDEYGVGSKIKLSIEEI